MTDSRITRRGMMVRAGAALCAGGLGVRAVAQDDSLVITPRQTEGPFYPRRKPADTDNDLTAFGAANQRAKGDLLTLGGRVLDSRGQPLSGARVELWHCDIHGTYHHVDASSQADQNFQGYGEMITDGEGHYRFRTIKPGLYTGRTRHIHFKVIAPGRRTLTSQMYFDTDMEQNLRDGIYRRLSGAERTAVTMKTRRTSGKTPVIEGRLNIVVA